MIPEQKAQHLIFTAILILILVLSYCAIPCPSADTAKKHKPQSRWILRPYLARLILGKSESLPLAKPEPVVKETSHEEIKKEAPEAKAPEPAAKKTAGPAPAPATATATALTKAGAEEGIILMSNPKYDSHTKPIVKFTHQKHKDTYSKSCGDCHHDAAGKPLDLKPGDPVKGCIECHKETKKKKGEKLEMPEKIRTYHNEALHANCIECHKASNIKKGDPKGMNPAPVACKGCHQ